MRASNGNSSFSPRNRQPFRPQNFFVKNKPSWKLYWMKWKWRSHQLEMKWTICLHSFRRGNNQSGIWQLWTVRCPVSVNTLSMRGKLRMPRTFSLHYLFLYLPQTTNHNVWVGIRCRQFRNLASRAKERWFSFSAMLNDWRKKSMGRWTMRANLCAHRRLSCNFDYFYLIFPVRLISEQLNFFG